MLERSHEYEKMAHVEQEHWWYVALHHLVLRALRHKFAHIDPAIIDAGCGTGGLMLFLRDRGYSDLQGFDLSEDAVRLLSGTTVECSSGQSAEYRLTLSGGKCRCHREQRHHLLSGSGGTPAIRPGMSSGAPRQRYTDLQCADSRGVRGHP